jgi:UDP-galactopyranose mutase
MVRRLLEGVDIRLDTPYKKNEIPAKKIVYTGAIDEFFGYRLGTLEYRSLRFEHESFASYNVQGNAVINYTSSDIPYTRKIEHRHFDRECVSEKSIVTTEYPESWTAGAEPYYPVNDDKNNALYQLYCGLADAEPDVIFGGRLGMYRYFDMDKVIEEALVTAEKELRS